MISYRHNVPAPERLSEPSRPDGRFRHGNKMGKGRPPRARRQTARLLTCPVCDATFFKSIKTAKTCSRDCAATLKRQSL